MDNTTKMPAYQWLPYRWVMLIMIALVQIATNFCNIQVAAGAGTVMQSLKLSTAQFGAVTACGFLSGAFLGIAAGGWADKIGIKKVLNLALIVSILGCVWRIYSNSFATLFISMFLIGVSMAALNANSTKILAMWFHPSQMNLAMSIYIACSTIGAVIALSTTPRILTAGGTMQKVYTIGAATVVAATVLWIIFARVKPTGAPDIKSEPVMKYIGSVIKLKNLWLNAITMFCIMGLFITCSSFMVVTFTNFKGIDPVTAGNYSTATSLIAVPLMIIMPVIFTKMRWIKKGVITLLVVGAALMLISWQMETSWVSTIVLAFGISFMGNTIPLMKQFPALLPEIPRDSIGSAGGIHATMQQLGGFLVPSYILGAIVGARIDLIWYGIAAMAIIAAVLMLFQPEIGKLISADSESNE